MDNLKYFINQFVSPNDEELNSFLSCCKTVELSKGKTLIRRGQLCDVIYFLEAGYVKYSMLIKEKEMTIGLASHVDIVSDFWAFYTGNPALTTISAISDCKLYAIKRADLEEQYAKYKIWERFGRLLAENGLLEQIMERIDFQTKTPQELYLKMLENEKGIFENVSLRDIAQSLGITQESLSRIRARI